MSRLVKVEKKIKFIDISFNLFKKTVWNDYEGYTVKVEDIGEENFSFIRSLIPKRRVGNSEIVLQKFNESVPIHEDRMYANTRNHSFCKFVLVKSNNNHTEGAKKATFLFSWDEDKNFSAFDIHCGDMVTFPIRKYHGIMVYKPIYLVSIFY